jgi:hypothetical protein
MIIYIALFIIFISLVLYLWSQYNYNNMCKQNFTNNNLHSNLVFTSAGDNTNFYDYWCDKNRNYDIWLVYYGDNDDNYNKYKKYVNKIWRRKGTKFQNFNYIYKNELFDKKYKYDRFFITDDDIIINSNDINRLFDISREYDLSICQPSFSDDSKISHIINKNQPGNILRFTNFVEVNTPVFSKDALNKFMNIYSPELVEWGVDYLFIWSNDNKQTNKFAIIDSIICKNPHDEEKKITKREIDNVKEHKNSAQIWYDYAMKIGCPYDWPHITYKTIPRI